MAKHSRHKRSKRLLSVMLSALLVFNTLGLSAFAAEDTAPAQQSAVASFESGSAQEQAGASAGELIPDAADPSAGETQIQGSEAVPEEGPAQESEDAAEEEQAQAAEDAAEEEQAQAAEDAAEEEQAQAAEATAEEGPAQAAEDADGETLTQNTENAPVEELIEEPAEQTDSAMNDAVGAAQDGEMTTWADLQEAINAAENGDVITVENDLKAGPSDSALNIPGNTEITLDLKGTLDRNLTASSAAADGSVIINAGVLTITGGGTITGGNTTGEGGGIRNSGTLTLDGVNIMNNHAGNGGAVYSYFGRVTLTDGALTGNSAALGGGLHVMGGSVEMQGGLIKENTAENGAGLYVWEAEFRQSGGEICENAADVNGGAVFLEEASYEMTGGTMNGNSAENGSAVYVDLGSFMLAGGTISGNISGNSAVYLNGSDTELRIVSSEEKITVTGNFDRADVERNVYLKSGQLIRVEGAPADGSVIGVTTRNVPSNGNPVQFAALSGGVSAAAAGRSFVSDAGYDVDNGSGSLLFKYNRISTWQDLQEALAKGGEKEWDPSIGEEGEWINIIRLTDDLTAGSGDHALSYDHSAHENIEVILDLCGHTVDRGLDGPASDGHVLKMESGSLIIRDSKGGGKITGGNSNGDGGGIYISGGTLTLESGTVTGNRAQVYGGGICVSDGIFRQTGGSITGNTAMVGGVCVKNGSSYEVSGTPVVTGNADDFQNSSNVYLPSDSVIRVTGGLADGARLGITSDIAKTVTGGYAQYYDESIPVGQYFDNDNGYNLYYGPDKEVAIEIGHTSELTWTWTETDDGVQATAEMKCVNCGEVKWTETAEDISGPGAYSDEEDGFGFTAEVTHDGETYSDTMYTAPEHVDAFEPRIDDEGEYHPGMEEHYVLKFGGSAYYYTADGGRPGEQVADPALLADNIFVIDGESICSYCGEFGDEETVITLPKTYNGSALKYIGNNSSPFYLNYDKPVTIYAADQETKITGHAFEGCGNVTIVGPHRCRLTYGEHDDAAGHYTVEYSDDHIFQAIDELTEWAEDFSSAVIHIECIRESCCFYDVAIEDTTVTSELVDGKIEYYASGEYNGATYTVSTVTDAYTVKFDPDNGTDEAVSFPCSKIYTLPGSDKIGFTAPVGAALRGWKDESGREYAPEQPVALTSQETVFTAVWASEWALVNSALQVGKEVTLRNDITAGADDTALTVPSGVTATLNFNGFKADRGLKAAVENGYAVRVEGTLRMNGGDGSESGDDIGGGSVSPASGSSANAVSGLITGGCNIGDGGGIFVAETGNADIRNVDIKSNSSANGAGIYLAAGGVAVAAGSYIMYNVASAKGGGAFVSAAGKFTAGPGSQIIENVANEGAGVYICDGGSSTYTGPDTKVKNNTKPSGDHNNVQPENFDSPFKPVSITGPLSGLFIGFTSSQSSGLWSFLTGLGIAYGISNFFKHFVSDKTKKKSTPDQEDPKCDHPARSAFWFWSSDYTKATALLTCDNCGDLVDKNTYTEKAVGEDGVTTYTANVEHGSQTFTDVKRVNPYTVILNANTQYSAAGPVVKKVPHDKNQPGHYTLDLPQTFIPFKPALPDKWKDDATLESHDLGSDLEVFGNCSLTLQWFEAHKVTYKKGAADVEGDEYGDLAKHDAAYKLLPCLFARPNYDFTKWNVRVLIGTQEVDRGEFAVEGSFRAETDFNAYALWQSKWTTLREEMTKEQESSATIDLTQDVIAQEGDEELLVPAGKTVTLNMNGFTLDRNLSAASAKGSVIRVKGTLILNGPGTLKGGYSTDSASGIILESGGKLKISGALNITGNGADAGNGNSGDANNSGRNVYVPENAKIEVTGALNDAKIGITTAVEPKAGSPVVFTDGLNGTGGKDNFVSDDSSYTVGLNKDGEAFLDSQVVIVNGVTGSFRDKINLNYYFDFPESVLADKKAYVTLTRENRTPVNLLIKDAFHDPVKGYKFSIPLAAKEASDTITAKVFDGGGTALKIKSNKDTDYGVAGVSYTLMQYFDWLERNGKDAEEKAIGAAAKDYCSAAQIYFNYKADGLSVSSAVNNVTEAMLSDYVSKRNGTLPAGVSVEGISAMLESDNTLRLYFGFKKGVKPSSFDFTIDGNKAGLKQRKDGMYFLALETGVLSNQLHNAHIYSISDGTNTYTVTASVLTYARSVARKSDKALSDLGKALYLYNRAAITAFNN